MSPNARVVGTGYCSATIDGWEGDCTKGHAGTWRISPSLPDHAACIERCLACARCRFVSVSLKNGDCSWSAGCAVGSLSLVYGGESYTTYRVRRGRRVCSSGDGERRTPTNHSRSGVHFVTFYSEGPPRDQGIPLGAMAGVIEAAFSPHVDSFRAYTPTQVAASALEWTPPGGVRRRVPGRRVVRASRVEASMNTGLSAIGQLAAKPFVILLRLLELQPGELLVFKDANVLKRPNLLGGAREVGAVARWTLREAAPAQDVFIPFENDRLKLKHHCKAYAIRELAPRESWERLFEAPLHHSCQLVARRTPAAEAFLFTWLEACLRRDVLEQLPDPPQTRHPHFRWHTHEQCLYSIVAATHANQYRRNLWYCWVFERERVRELGAAHGPQHCEAPDSDAARSWLPANASRHGHCLGIECTHLSPRCPKGQWYLSWARTRPGGSCERAFAGEDEGGCGERSMRGGSAPVVRQYVARRRARTAVEDSRI